MRGIATGSSTVGGTPVIPTQVTFTINGKPALLSGDLTTPHPTDIPGTEILHLTPQPILGTGFMTYNGRNIVLVGDLALCGHPVEVQEFWTFE